MNARRIMLAELNKHRARAFAEAESSRVRASQGQPTLDEMLGAIYQNAGAAVASIDDLTELVV